jgi:hypothetical protein
MDGRIILVCWNCVQRRQPAAGKIRGDVNIKNMKSASRARLAHSRENYDLGLKLTRCLFET